MYGGYRDLKNTESDSNPSASARPSAPTTANRLRSLRNLSGLTQPVRTKDLLDELREVYDDMDSSASKQPVNPLENDPALSWDKQSFPKSLEWMTPASAKSKASNSNTIPETVGSLNIRNKHCRAGWLASGETQSSSSVNSSTDRTTATPSDEITPGVVLPTPPVVLDEFEKENVFRPLKTKSTVSLPDPHGLLSSTKKCHKTEARSEVNSYQLNTELVHRTAQKEFFTPLKRVRVDSMPATSAAQLVGVHSSKIPTIHETPSSDSKSSPPEDHLHKLSSGRRSPVNMHPHLSLLTPITQIRPSGSVVTTSKKLAFSSFPHSLDNQHSLNDILMTPAKGYPQESKSAKPFNQSSLVVPLEDKIKGEKDILSTNCTPLDILRAKPCAPKSVEEIPEFENPNILSMMTPLTKNVPLNVHGSCLSTPVSLVSHTRVPTVVTPAPVAKVKSRQEMPPPSIEVRKHLGKTSPESVPHAMNHSIGLAMGEKKSTNENIQVNGKSYTILSQLGRGGSSVVYLVLEPGTSNLLAVKCVNLSELDKSTYDGYLNEIALLAKLQDSDCVIRMFDHQHCKEEKLLYVVMEKGETDLSKLIRAVSSTKKISPAMIVYYWTEMLNAVSFIHNKGTIHSDLKPANFLLVAGRLKLIDFGIASVIQADMTSVLKDNMTGTYNYISPEALCSTGPGPDGRSVRYKISCKSDVWSLGCILYNLVYGHTPFQSITHQFAKMKAIADPKHKISFPLAPGCPQALIHAMQACLVREPKLRPSVDDLLTYPYLGSVDPPVKDKFSELFEKVHFIAHSSQSPSEKILSIQSVLSTCQSSMK